MTQANPSRRAVLAGMCAVAAVGLTGFIELSPAEAASAIKVRGDGKVDVTLSALKKVGSALALPSLGGAIVKVSATKYVAWNLACTHQGVPVAAKGTAWTCPAHGSQFNPKTGAVVRGPASSPLAKLPLKISKGIATVG